jgi:serine/threonine protein kinase
MGEVYRARDTRLGRTVAIKVLPPQLSADIEFRERFEREARVISKLSHPHICALYDIGAQDGLHYLVMEFLEGENLAERLKKGRCPLPEALRIAGEIAEALECAHRSGITHRDLKPSNIALTRDGAKLLDFGVAKPTLSLDAGVESTLLARALTTQGQLVGTVPYMAPEQLEGRPADPRTDIFALGNVIYEMVTGRAPFSGNTQASLIANILSSQPPPISTCVPSAPPALDRIVQACLAKKPDDRWQSAQDLRLQLNWLDEPALLPKGRGREKLAWGAGFLLLVLALLLAMAHFRSSPQLAQPVRSSLMPPSNSDFLPYHFAVSPDGTHLAFVAVGPDGKNTLWVRALSSSIAQQLNSTDDASYPFWSPDGNRIGFFAEGKLKTADRAGGGVHILCESPLGLGGSWSSNGTIVFASHPVGPLYRIPSAGGSPASVTRIAREHTSQAHRWPFFLPDGKHFLYFQDWNNPADAPGNGIYVGSLDGGEAKLVSSESVGSVAFASGHLLYLRDRTLMAQPFDPDRLELTGHAIAISDPEVEKDLAFSRSGFSVAENGVLFFQSAADSPSRLIWFDASGKEQGQLPGAGYKYPRLSPDGRFLAVAADDQRNGRYFVRVFDLGRGISTRLTDAANESENNPVWSSDGRQIAYPSASADGSTYSIYRAAADGSGSPQMLLKGAKMLPNDWSSDGHLLFMDFEKGPPSLSVYLAGRDQAALEKGIASFAAEARFAPDGKWLAYQGALAIFVQPFPLGSGGRLQISSAGGSQPCWSRDGKQVFYIAPDRKLMAVAFDAQKKIASVPRALFQTRIVAPNYALYQYDVAPDGRFLINSFPSSHSSPLTLLTHWTAQLKK